MTFLLIHLRWPGILHSCSSKLFFSHSFEENPLEVHSGLNSIASRGLCFIPYDLQRIKLQSSFLRVLFPQSHPCFLTNPPDCLRSPWCQCRGFTIQKLVQKTLVSYKGSLLQKHLKYKRILSAFLKLLMTLNVTITLKSSWVLQRSVFGTVIYCFEAVQPQWINVLIVF